MIDYLKIVGDYKEKEILSIFDNYAYLLLDGKKYLIRLVSKDIINTYEILKNYDLNINHPIKLIEYDNKQYMLFRYNIPKGENIARAKAMIDSLKELHKKTYYDITIDSKSLERFNKIYKILDYRFTSLENSIRYLENTTIKGDYNWAYLSKYYIVLDAKKRLLKLQEEIIKEIKKGKSLKYCLCHGYPSIINYNSSKLDGFFYSKMAIPSSDIARFYVLNDDIYDLINPIIKAWIKDLGDKFYKIYFEFYVLYLYILSLDQALSINYESLYNYLQTTKKIRIFLKNYK
ncbi:MAG: hypothetical protein ACI35W_02855 [Anaeroplasmataceae bacterium]